MSIAFKTICRFDEALDAEAMGPDGVRAYRETGDESKVKLRDGMTPTVFHCRRLKVSEMQTVLGHVTEADRFAAAFARGITRCEDLRTESGGRTDWTRPDSERPVAQAVIDQMFDAAEVQEVGAAIFGRSLLGKGRPATWPLPATSRYAVEALVFHLAEQTRRRVAGSHQSSGEADQTAPATPG